MISSKRQLFNNKFVQGVGVDIEQISRFNGMNLENERIFLEHLFTRSELNYCFKKKYPQQHLAARFAAKEAVIKAMGGIKRGWSYHDIEIIVKESGKPFVKICSSKKGRALISLSHSQGFAIAFAFYMD